MYTTCLFDNNTLLVFINTTNRNGCISYNGLIALSNALIFPIVFSLLVFVMRFFNALLYALKKVTPQDITYRLKIIGIF